MKRKLFKSIALAALIGSFGAVLPASAGQLLRVNVPFSFVVAGKEFSPGQYRVEQAENGLIFVQGEGHAAAVMSYPGSLDKSSGTGLRFTTDQSREVLVGVQIEGETSRAIPVRSFAERKLTISSR
jgi:hypothetical protein